HTILRSLPLTPPATSTLSTLSLHDALPISRLQTLFALPRPFLIATARLSLPIKPASSTASGRQKLRAIALFWCSMASDITAALRSEEHTSELQSRFDLVCRLLLEKKKKEQ